MNIIIPDKGTANNFFGMLPISLIFVFSLGSLSACLAQSAPSRNPVSVESATSEIVFDASHNQLWSIWDTGVVGYSNLAISLRNSGYKVSESQTALQKLLDELQTSSVLVLGAPQYSPYTAAETKAVVGFVERGGALLILGEHEDFFSINHEQNKIASEFGITFKANLVNDPVANINGKPQWINVSSKELGLDKIGLFAVSTIELADNALSLASASRHANIEAGENENIQSALNILNSPLPSPPASNLSVIASATRGRGKVVAISDTELFWNWSNSLGFSYGDNEKLIHKIFQLLTSTTASASSKNHRPSKTIDINSSRVIIDETHNARSCDNSLSGLRLFKKKLEERGLNLSCENTNYDFSVNDTIIIANPLERYTQEDVKFYKRARRVILLNESFTSIKPPSTFALFLNLLGHRPIEAPINSLAKELGAEFKYHMLQQPSPSLRAELNYSIDHKLGTFHFFRSNAVSLTEPARSLTAPKGIWGESQPFNMRGWKQTNQYDQDNDIAQPSILEWNSSLLAIGDVDPITNAHVEENDGLVEFISWWINSEQAKR